MIDAAVTDVTVAGRRSSRRRFGPASARAAPESRYERALGVRGGTVVEVSLAVTPAGERQPDPGCWAVRIAETMLDKSQ